MISLKKRVKKTTGMTDHQTLNIQSPEDNRPRRCRRSNLSEFTQLAWMTGVCNMLVQRKANQSCLVLTVLSNGQGLMLSSVNTK